MRSYAALRRLNVGCGPHHIRPDWWNVDIRSFPGVDEVRDILSPWPWRDARFVYCEHFIEHLELDEAFRFLLHAGSSLEVGGKIRISTPNLTYVAATHYHASPAVRPNQCIAETLAINCAFRGWGHRFLWSSEMMTYVLEELGFEGVESHDFGRSGTDALRSLELHTEHYVFQCGEASVINVEATRGAKGVSIPPSLVSRAEKELLSHIRSGH